MTLVRHDGRLGFFVPLDHEDVIGQARTFHPWVDARIEYDRVHIEEWAARLVPFLDDPYFLQVDDEESTATDPYWNNGFFTGIDARTLFAFIAAARPRRYVEIGSGNSTRWARKAVETHSPGTHMMSIDPAPRRAIHGIADLVDERSLLDVDPSVFRSLEPDDILFLDGSHLSQSGTDTVSFFLDILPEIPQGVHVHVHDIALPYGYPEVFVDRGYSEQFVLAAFLLGNFQWRVTFPVSWSFHRGVFDKRLGSGVSFWMQKT